MHGQLNPRSPHGQPSAPQPAGGGVLGLHHITAIAGDPQRNLEFYTGVLGLRLVKRTVNYDDPATYHFYFGDETGTPGSILTFFPWPGTPAGRPGPGQAAVVSFAIPPAALGFWLQHFLRNAVKHEPLTRRDAGDGRTEQVLAFRDPDGLLLELVAHPGAVDRPSWGGAAGIPGDLAIHGFHSVSLWVVESEATEKVLVEVLGFRLLHESGTTRRFMAGDGGPGRLVDLRTIGRFTEALSGAGTVHHVAWAVADDWAEQAVREQLIRAGLTPTPVIDRTYFHSVYFQEPGGILFELATITPGFTVDEPVGRLGERLMLPPRLEPERAAIERGLPAILVPTPPPGSTFLSPGQGTDGSGPNRPQD